MICVCVRVRLWTSLCLILLLKTCFITSVNCEWRFITGMCHYVRANFLKLDVVVSELSLLVSQGLV